MIIVALSFYAGMAYLRGTWTSSSVEGTIVSRSAAQLTVRAANGTEVVDLSQHPSVLQSSQPVQVDVNRLVPGMTILINFSQTGAPSTIQILSTAAAPTS